MNDESMKLKWNQDRAEWAFRENCFFSSSFSNSSTWKVREWKERKAKFETHAENNKHTNAHTSITVMLVHKIGKWETKRQIKEEKICNLNGMRYHGTWSKLRQWYKNICFLYFFLVWVQTKCYPLQWNSFCNFSFLLLEYCFFLYFFIFVLFYFFLLPAFCTTVLMLAHIESWNCHLLTPKSVESPFCEFVLRKNISISYRRVKFSGEKKWTHWRVIARAKKSRTHYKNVKFYFYFYFHYNISRTEGREWCGKMWTQSSGRTAENYSNDCASVVDRQWHSAASSVYWAALILRLRPTNQPNLIFNYHFFHFTLS